jgi:hypothetical protein
MTAGPVLDGRIGEPWGVPDRFVVLARTGALDHVPGWRRPPAGPFGG